MSEESVETPCLRIRAIVGSDGDLIDGLVDSILGEQTDVRIFCLMHDWFAPDSGGAETALLDLCLPSRRPGSSLGRYLPVLHLRLTKTVARGFLFLGEPLTATFVKQHLALDLIRETYKPILFLIRSGQTGRDDDDIIGLISWHRKTVIRTLRKLAKVTPSVNWMINNFGAYEAELVLTSAAYFFTDLVCTKETLRHLVALFTRELGWQLVAITGYAELCRIYSASMWLGEVKEFTAYAAKKLARDDAESALLDETVNSFRGQLLLPHRDTIRYIYLCFHQCLNKTTFSSYSQQTSRHAISNSQRGEICRGLDAEFRENMLSMFNKDRYLTTNMNVSQFRLGAMPKGYTCFHATSSLDSRLRNSGSDEEEVGGEPRRWYGQSRDVGALLRSMNECFPSAGLGEEFSHLFELACHPGLRSAQTALLGGAGRYPVFRSEFQGKHYFILAADDDPLEEHWRKTIRYPTPEWLTAEYSEEILTQGLLYDELQVQLDSPETQFLVSRHEFFNPRLPVFNLVLDLDLRLDAATAGPSFQSVRRLCHALRTEILDALRILGEIRDDHYILFFKSSCPRDEAPRDLDYYFDSEGVTLANEGPDESSHFCSCTEKLGLRIITSLPTGVIMVGTEPVTSLVKIINRLTKINPEINTLFPQVKTCDEGPFDLGIYRAGHSIRLPHTYKTRGLNALEGLLKLLIILPPGCDLDGYLARAVDLRYLLHHAHPPDHGDGPCRAVLGVDDKSDSYLARRVAEQLPRVKRNIDKHIEELTGQEVTSWVAARAWPQMHEFILQYLPNAKARQFDRVRFERVGHNMVLLKPRQGGNFQCLRFDHRSRSQTTRIFLALYSANGDNIVLTLMSQCFSQKCNSNKSTPHFSTTINIKTG